MSPYYVLSTILSLCIMTHLSHPHELDTIIIYILEIWKLKHRDIK